MDLADLGPFFGVERTHGVGWRPLRDLYGAALEERVAHVARALEEMTGAAVESRVAASTMSLGLFARLVAPQLAAAVLDRPLPPLDPDRTYWQPAAGGPWPLALTGEEVTPDLAAALSDVLLPLADEIGSRLSLSARVLHGNLASALFGAVRMVGGARPDLAAAAARIGSSLLEGPLAGTGAYRGEFVRSSCCLYYRIPGGGYCGDCVLAGR